MDDRLNVCDGDEIMRCMHIFISDCEFILLFMRLASLRRKDQVRRNDPCWGQAHDEVESYFIDNDFHDDDVDVEVQRCIVCVCLRALMLMIMDVRVIMATNVVLMTASRLTGSLFIFLFKSKAQGEPRNVQREHKAGQAGPGRGLGGAMEAQETRKCWRGCSSKDFVDPGRAALH